MSDSDTEPVAFRTRQLSGGRMQNTSDPTSDTVSDEQQRLSAISERGINAVQDLLEVLHETERETTVLLQRIRQLETLVWTDTLTGLLNRRGIDEEIAREEARARRYGSGAAVVVLVVEGLPDVNDRFGRATGDILVRAVGGALRAAARDTDIVARMDGSLFASVLPGADIDGARVFLRRVQSSARFVQLPDGTAWPLRLSVGIATREQAGTLSAALDEAFRGISASGSAAHS